MTSPSTTLPSCPHCGIDCKVGYGKCHCGCRKETCIPVESHSRDRRIKGGPMKFRPGHHMLKTRIDTSQMGHFKIEGVYCRLIPLTKGQYAIVWESDYEWLSGRKWFASLNRLKNCHYAMRRYRKPDGKWGTIMMHREVLNPDPDDPRTPDHIDTEKTLENRRDNLRMATRSQQGMNKKKYQNSAIPLKGVSEASDGKAFVASIQVDGVAHYLGRFKTPELAHEAYCEAAKKLFREFARFK